MSTGRLAAIAVILTACAAGAGPAGTARAAAGLDVEDFMVRAERGEPLDADRRRLAAGAYGQWLESERVPGAKPGNPAVGRALEKLSSGVALSSQERHAISTLRREARTEAATRAARGGTGVTGPAGTGGGGGGGGAGEIGASDGAAVRRYGAVLAAGAGSVVLVTILGLVAMRRRSSRQA